MQLFDDSSPSIPRTGHWLMLSLSRLFALASVCDELILNSPDNRINVLVLGDFLVTIASYLIVVVYLLACGLPPTTGLPFASLLALFPVSLNGCRRLILVGWHTNRLLIEFSVWWAFLALNLEVNDSLCVRILLGVLHKPVFLDCWYRRIVEELLIAFLLRTFSIKSLRLMPNNALVTSVLSVWVQDEASLAMHAELRCSVSFLQ